MTSSTSHSPLVRFAPSPTGYLHIGNARPALFNWLFARRHHGRFLLRYDDTDIARSKAEYADAIAEDLRWLGIRPDAVIRQSERLAIYDAAADQLRAAGRLYACYETPDELDRRRKRQLARGLPPIYDRAALKLTAEQKAAFAAEGRKPHWRFLLEARDIAWDDLVRGPSHVDCASLSDPVLVREDGSYLYTLPSVVDDVETGVSHVIRGEDHVTNTAVQAQIFEALGAALPVFGHHNLLTTVSGEGLSKRTGALSIQGLREDGIAFDDGTTWRLGEHDFLMTTTTANAGKVMQHLEYFLDVIWPELRVTVTSVTDQWAGAAIGGPKAREILATCVEGTAVDNAALPFMGIVHGKIAGVPVMICRLSFSGEMAFEVYCGSGHGTHVWQALIEAGKPFGLVPYGLEALGTMRIEKGHVTGAEIDGRTTARDLHLDWMLSKKKPFIGSAMMDREGLAEATRLQLVGIVALDNRPLNGGAHVVEELDQNNPHGSIGHITACCYSPMLGKYIALALVKGGSARLGTRAFVSDPLRKRFGPVEIVSNHFFDPEGSRMHG